MAAVQGDILFHRHRRSRMHSKRR